MKEYFFIPIFKSKASAEPKAIAQCKTLFSQRVVPFIEIIDEKSSKGYQMISSTLSDTLHFEQYYRKDNDLLSTINLTNESIGKHVIPCLHIKSSDELNSCADEIIQMINNVHIHTNHCAIRIPAGIINENLILVLSSLSSKDYLFIDIGTGMYSSASGYIKYIKTNFSNPAIIIISNERPNNLTGSSMEQNGFNRTFNTSIIDAIKKGAFNSDGFGSFCSARDDLNQVALPLKVYATFLIYNYKHNGFFSIKTTNYDIVARIYKELKYVISSYKSVIDDLFILTPISKNMINEFLKSNKKGNASTYISISIVHYIEEIVNNINTAHT